MAKDGIRLNTVRQSKGYKAGFRAPDGEHSANYAVIAPHGKDLVIEVPTGVTVIAEEFQRTLAEFNNHNDRVMVANGGRGGDRTNSFCGTKGQRMLIKLDLKMIADVGLVGFPNAGKSTLLRALSRASPKIASYPFTTIRPNLGVIEYDLQQQQKALVAANSTPVPKSTSSSEHYLQDYRQITVADLPGLIDGAHKNIGLGHKFLKHIVRTKLLLFVVDIDGFRNVGGENFHKDWSSQEPIKVIQSLVNELDLYDSNILRTKPSMLVITKLDDSKKRTRFDKLVPKLKDTKITIPSKENARKELRGENDADQDEFATNQETRHGDFEFDKVVGISSVKRLNIEQLKGMIRRLIDIDAESKQQNISFKQLLAKNKSDLDFVDDMYTEENESDSENSARSN